ncbi:major facilitator superfamily domain-containing protein 4A-like isoform X2 [Stegodyphus dumicola]|uniref:major facilitator superfamily domain-containing protein 4A-like isoform X2 n=1 Tax=Stegodyphus dumicola TaxID=202533 RepID=UPI0015A89F47|nr:major facilitator superfamily domain-containing protein 4A-like isoform X2 [Stegodyphus dumicola]
MDVKVRVQAVYGGYLYSYAVKGPVNLKRSNAAYLNALFWGMFAAGRLISIALATRLAPAFMLGCNIVGCTFGMLLMLALKHSKGILIFGTCIIGLFMSSVFPTALSLTEQYIKVTPTITSFLVFGAALGEMSMPVVLGHEFDRAGPITFLITGVVLCFLSLIIYMVLWIVGRSVAHYTGSSVTGLFSSCFPSRAAAEGEETSLTTQHVRYYSRMKGDTSENSLDAQQESSFTEQPTSQPQ